MTVPAKQGWTLLELMTVLAIAGALFFLALPSFHLLFSKTHLEVAKQQLLSAIRLARSEAIKNGAISNLHPLTGRWVAGQEISVAGHAVQKLPALSGVTVTWAGFPAGDELRFLPSGFIYESNGTFSICADGVGCTKILVSKSGRVRVV